MPSNVITFGEALAWVHERTRAYWAGELDGYCIHGTWVGGCGIDWMCGRCESDQPLFATEWAMEIVREERRYAIIRELNEMRERIEAVVGETKLFTNSEIKEMWTAWIHLTNATRIP